MSGAAARTGSFKKIQGKMYVNDIKDSTRITKLKTGSMSITENMQEIVGRINRKDCGKVSDYIRVRL